jgi:hypothetical protein
MSPDEFNLVAVQIQLLTRALVASATIVGALGTALFLVMVYDGYLDFKDCIRQIKQNKGRGLP